MRKLVLLIWVLLPVGAAAYHFGPGQEWMKWDDAMAQIAEAESQIAEARALDSDAAREHWEAAEEAYLEAMDSIPSDRVDLIRATKLELAKVKMFVSKLPEARNDLQQLVDDMQADAQADADVLAEARSALANAQYYRTWLMRLEGHKREIWEPEIEAARQTYKLLAEQSQSTGNQERLAKAEEDLEAAVRLARMDLTELQGLPCLPNETAREAVAVAAGQVVPKGRVVSNPKMPEVQAEVLLPMAPALKSSIQIQTARGIGLMPLPVRAVEDGIRSPHIGVL